MNIQIFGKSKCFDTKKAERWFKERRIKFQAVDLTSWRSCWTIPSCSRPPSSATAGRPPWATARRYGRAGAESALVQPGYRRKLLLKGLHRPLGPEQLHPIPQAEEPA